MKPHIVITYPFPLGRPNGGARMTREIARHVGMGGVKVTVIALSAAMGFTFPQGCAEDEHLAFEFDEEFARHDVRIIRVKPHPLHWVLDARVVKRAVKRLVENERVDMVLSYYTEGAFLPDFLAARGIPFGFIATWQSYAAAMAQPVKFAPGRYARRIRTRMLSVPYRRAEVIFATSNYTKNELVQVLGVNPNKIQICPLGVDASFFDVPREKPKAIRNILFFGRVIQSKGVWDMLEALGQLKAAGGPEFHCRIRGLGYLDEARERAAKAGLTDEVEVFGPADDKELKEELANADLAILPSHFEAFGLAFAEAQAAGLPVIAYSAGSVPEVILDGKSGWLGPVGDVGVLRGHIEAALADTEGTYAFGIAGREHVLSNFTWPRTAQRITDGVAKVCGENFVPQATQIAAEELAR